jgi:hypothetical protein
VAEVTVACAPFILTTLFDVVVLKFVPVMVIEAPTPAELGVKPEIVGVVTVNDALLVAVPAVPTVTEIFPLVVPAGAMATICVVVAEVTEVAVVPLNLTVSFEIVVLKFVPVTVTDVPIGPEVGAMLVIVGAAAGASDHTLRRIQKQSPCRHRALTDSVSTLRNLKIFKRISQNAARISNCDRAVSPLSLYQIGAASARTSAPHFTVELTGAR